MRKKKESTNMTTAATRRGTASTSPSNVTADKSQSLQTFSLLDLQQYTHEKTYSNTASKDFHLFYVGRDDVHDILKHVLSRVRVRCTSICSAMTTMNSMTS